MASMRQIREALADTLTAAELGARQVSAYMLTNPSPPSLLVGLDISEDGVRFDRAMARGLDELPLAVVGLVTSATDIGSQQLLDQWLYGANTVKAALEADKTLGGAVQATHVHRVRATEYVRDGGGMFYGAVWSVRVLANE